MEVRHTELILLVDNVAADVGSHFETATGLKDILENTLRSEITPGIQSAFGSIENVYARAQNMSGPPFSSRHPFCCY
jgi:hypothetical protein